MPERVIGLPARLGKTGASGLWSMRRSQARSWLAVCFQSGTTRSLRPLPWRWRAEAAVEEQVGDAQAGEFGDAGAGVVEHGEQDGVALAAPAGLVGCGEQRLDLGAGEEVERGRSKRFAEIASTRSATGKRGRVAERGVAHERADRGQAEVARARACCRARSRGGRGRRAPSGASRSASVSAEGVCPVLLLGVAEQQLEGVAVARDRVCAGAALGEQTPLEELLQQRREAGRGEGHDPPLSWPRAKRSKRCAAIAISSGTPVRYQ